MHVVAPTQFPPNDDVIPSENPETDSEDEVTNQFVCRLGRMQLTHDGQLGLIWLNLWIWSYAIFH